MLLILMFLMGLALTAGPWVLLANGLFFDTLSATITSVIGVITLMMTLQLLVFTRLYVRASANTAYVRTGQGGVHVLIDRGTIVIPALHSLVPVSLEMMKLQIDAAPAHGLRSSDGHAVALSAEFHARVLPRKEAVLLTATTFGDRATDPTGVCDLMNAKLVQALRLAVGERTLDELLSDREALAAHVAQLAAPEVASTGLTLDSVVITTISER